MKFEIGKYYKHQGYSGARVKILGALKSERYGDILIQESDQGHIGWCKEQAPKMWIEIDEKDWDENTNQK